MSHSVWSRGRIVGLTDLGFVYREHGVRFGWFHPNELGEKLMPAATGVAPAMRASRENGTDLLKDPDVNSAIDHERALELELRGPNGKVIETKQIAIIDTHYLLAIPTPGDEDEWQTECEDDEPWREPEDFPRYQIQAHLVDHNAIP